MAPHFNDSHRTLDLKELCGHCTKRLGVHSMLNNCPFVGTNGTHRRTDFTEQTFKPTQQYEQTNQP